MSSFKNICCGVTGILCCCYGNPLTAQNSNGKTTPFTIRGNVGASANFYSSNEVVYSRPSFGWNVNGNFIAKVNQVTLPFSFVINQYTNSNAYLQAGISPTYKWAKLHIGYRYIPFSPFTFEGQSFKGVGIELNPKLFHFAAFYGKLNKAVNQDTSRNHFAFPVFSRTGYGIKIGYGNLKSSFSLFYFHAKDDSSSVSFVNDSTKNNSISAQENAVLGASFRLKILTQLSWTGDIAISGVTQNLSSVKTALDSAYQYKVLAKILNNFVLINASSFASYAGQSTLSFYIKNYNSALSYRRVQPYFQSFGTPYLLNDIELVSLLNNFTVIKGKTNVSTNFSAQHNNLNKKLNSELQTQTGNVNVNTIVNQHLNLNLNYSGYYLKQKDGLAQLNDSVRMHQNISQFNLSPTYNFTKGTKIHFISGNVNVSVLNDKNAITSPRTNSNNLSTSINYTLGLIQKALNFSIMSLYNQYKQDSNSYKSYGITLGSSVQLLKEKNLNLQGNIGYLFNRFNSQGVQKNNNNNITYSFSAGYNAKHHMFSLFANYVYTPPNTINNIINKTFQYAVATKNLAGGISYNYSFY